MLTKHVDKIWNTLTKHVDKTHWQKSWQNLLTKHWHVEQTWLWQSWSFLTNMILTNMAVTNLVLTYMLHDKQGLARSLGLTFNLVDSPTLISKPKRNLDKVCRYATYYVGRRYMRKHARILHTLLWLMHQLSQSRKRCCISTFFITISTKNYYNESPISSIHHYSTVGDFEMFQ